MSDENSSEVLISEPTSQVNETHRLANMIAKLGESTGDILSIRDLDSRQSRRNSMTHLDADVSRKSESSFDSDNLFPSIESSKQLIEEEEKKASEEDSGTEEEDLSDEEK